MNGFEYASAAKCLKSYLHTYMYVYVCVLVFNLSCGCFGISFGGFGVVIAKQVEHANALRLINDNHELSVLRVRIEISITVDEKNLASFIQY